MDEILTRKNRTNLLKDAAQLLGVALYALSLNLLIMPLNLFSANLAGVAQVLNDVVHLAIGANSVNYTGTILYLFNIPLFVLSFRKLGKAFTIKSIIASTFMSVLIQFIPIPTTPIIEDRLTACILAGVIAGFGSGLTLRNGGSAGGSDILGLYFTQKFEDFSVGKLQNIISAAVYVYCLFRFDIETVVYSAIYLLVMSFMLDRTHTQNVKTSVIIFTKNQNVQDCILHDLNRGATCWMGHGCYNQTETYIFMTVLSKYEIPKLKELVHAADPDAFITWNDNIDVDGNYIVRL